MFFHEHTEDLRNHTESWRVVLQMRPDLCLLMLQMRQMATRILKESGMKEFT